MINKTEDPSLLRGRVMLIKETPDRRFCCLPHVPDPRTDQSPGLLQILGKYSCLFILILWLYPVVMEVLRSVKSETGKISLRPRVKIAQSPHSALRASWGDWLVFTLGHSGDFPVSDFTDLRTSPVLYAGKGYVLRDTKEP